MRGELCVVVCLGVLLAEGAAAGQEKSGTIHGLVRFTGELPPAKQLPTGDGGTIEHNDLVVDAKTRGLRWVIAALEDAPPRKFKGDETPVLIDQKDFLFIPRVVAVQQGQWVKFDNSDNVNHSVIIVSKIKENEVNVFVTKKDPLFKSFETEKAPLRVGCALHPSMTAWVYVAPHPWVAVTDEKGAFTIKDVPPGKYTLWVFHPDTRLEERKQVEVPAGQKAEAAFEWKEAKPRPRPRK
jgi:plastocyanin